MDRTVVTGLPTVWLAALAIALYVVPALAGVRLVRRRRGAEAPSSEVTGVALTVMAAVYGVMLAFAVVVLYQQFSDARDDVHAETGALATLHRASQELAPATAEDVTGEIRGYLAAVTGPEWDAMADGDESAEASQRLRGVYAVLGAATPATASERVFLERAAVALDEVVQARRVRLSAARSNLPGPFLVLLVGGGLLLMLFTLFFDLENRRYHDLVIVAMGALIGFSLMLCMALEYPFSGGISVSRDPYFEGALRDL